MSVLTPERPHAPGRPGEAPRRPPSSMSAKRFGTGLTEDQRRRHILAAARRTFGRLGYRRAQVGHILAEAGIARRTFYAYFKRKEDLAVELLGDFSAQVRDVRDVEGLRRVRTADELRSQYATLAAGLAGLFMQNREMILLLFEGQTAYDPVLTPRVKTVMEMFHSYVREYTAIAIKKRLVRPVNAEVISRLFEGMFFEAIRRVFVAGDPLPFTVWTQEVLDLIDFGFIIDPARDRRESGSVSRPRRSASGRKQAVRGRLQQRKED